ncbi:MAG: stage II sporulation protein R [Lachnospiraceae bacterium]|nr:stage II sporulation protein R [Lachnospiraceae bacterium]
MNRKTGWKRTLAGIVILAVLGTGLNAVYQRQNQQGIAEKILRFHVRANSDSEQDQKLKLAVRDEVGAMMGERLAEADSREESERIVKESLPDIVAAAQRVIGAQGYEYGVEAYVQDVDFPVKTYGAYTFPAGRYRALEVVIGEGEGHNWWCVMYPNMCFSGSVYQLPDEKSGEALKKTLTAEEYRSLMEEKNYRISFQSLSFLKNKTAE